MAKKGRAQAPRDRKRPYFPKPPCTPEPPKRPPPPRPPSSGCGTGPDPAKVIRKIFPKGVDREVDEAERVPDRRADHDLLVDGIDGEQHHQGDERDGEGDRGARNAEGAAVGTRDVRKAQPKGDERDHLQRVGDHGTEHRHVEEHRADRVAQY